MALSVTSGVVTAASGAGAKTYIENAQPVNIFGVASGQAASGQGLGAVSYFSGSDGNVSLNVNVSGGTLSANVSGNVVVISASGGQLLTGFSGALNVNISGGTISANVSGNTVVIAASGNFPLTMFSGALNVNISGGTINVTIAAYQSGTLVGISGGQLALSGLFVEISGQGVTTTVNPFGYQSGTLVGISGGSVGLSGLQGVAISGSVTVLGHVVSGGVQVSGTVGVSGIVQVGSGLVGIAGSGYVQPSFISGNLTASGISMSGLVISGVWVQPVLPVMYDYSGTPYLFPVATVNSGLRVLAVGGSFSGGVTVSGGITISGLVGISGGGLTISGGVQVSGFVGVLSGGTIPVSVVSGTAGATGWSNVSGGVQVSGTVGVSGQVIITSGGTIPVYLVSGNLTSGVVQVGRTATYSLASYWSGASPKGLIGIYNAGGTSGVSLEVVRVDVSIFASGNINRIDLILASGNISGTASSPKKRFTNDPASVVSGWVDGATQISGNTASGFALDSLLLEANSSGYLHNFTYEYTSPNARPPTILSGQEFWVNMMSGIGIGYIGLDWIERTLS